MKREMTFDDEAKKIKQEIESFQLPHKEAYKAMDDLKKKREEKRKQALLDRVTAIADLPENMRDSHSSEVLAAMQDLQANECLDFYGISHDALSARKRSLELLGILFTNNQKAEKDAEELARLKAESEARALKDREEAIAKKAADDARIAAEAKAEADRLQRETAEAAEAAEREAELAKQREQESIEKAAKEKLAAEEAAKQAAIDAELRAKQQAEQAAENERKRIEAEKAAEIAAAEKREANKAHHKKINNEAKADFIAGGLRDDQAELAVKLLAQKKIRHSVISY